MAYQVHNYQSGAKLYASQLNEMDAQIAKNEQLFDGYTRTSECEFEWYLGDININNGTETTGTSRYITTAFPFDNVVEISTANTGWGMLFILYDESMKYLGVIPGNKSSLMWKQGDIDDWLVKTTVNPAVKYARIRTYNLNRPEITIKRIENAKGVNTICDDVLGAISIGTGAISRVQTVGIIKGMPKASDGTLDATKTDFGVSFMRYPFNPDTDTIRVDWDGKNGVRFYQFDASDNLIGYIPNNTSGYSWSQSDLELNIKDALPNCAKIAVMLYRYAYTHDVQIEYRANNALHETGKKALTIASDTKVSADDAFDPFRTAKFLDHTFINATGNNIVIPNQSIFNIESSKRLGFTAIELNVNATQDGYIVLHGSAKKFGTAVTKADGSDISETAINSVTTAWVKENVRYVSKYARYKVAPLTLQEALIACKTNCLIPLIQIDSDEVREIADSIMGVGNYIAYTYMAERGNIVAPISIYASATSIDDVVAACNKYGAPFYYTLANPASFTEAQLAEMAQAVHSLNCRIAIAGCYLNETVIQKCIRAGFDYSSSDSSVNYFEHGNVVEAIGDMSNFSDFTTNGMVVDGALNMVNGNTVTLKTAPASVGLGKGCVSIVYKGQLSVAMGKMSGGFSYVNSTPDVRKWSTYFVEEAPTITITAKANTTIYSIVYNASRC